MWTKLINIEFADIEKFARGCYQRSLLAGNEALSGSTLKGKASKFGGRYKASRENLLDSYALDAYLTQGATLVRSAPKQPPGISPLGTINTSPNGATS